MAKRKEMSLIHVIEAVHRALDKYSSENVDVVLNEETEMLDVIYHSRHNSFGIESNVASVENINLRELENELESLNVGWVW